MPTNNNVADATRVVITTDGGTFTDTISNVGYTLEAGPDSGDLISSPDFRSAWWTYVAQTDGPVTFDIGGSTVYGFTVLLVLEGGSDPGSGPDSNLIEYVSTDFTDPWVTRWATAGTMFWLRVSVDTDRDQTYVLSVTGPASEPTGQALAAPSIDTVIGTRNDDFADVEGVFIAHDGDTYTSNRVPSLDYTVQPREPEDGTYRSAWWRYHPYRVGNVVVTATGAPEAPLTLGVYIGPDLARVGWYEADHSGHSAGVAWLDMAVWPIDWYFRVSVPAALDPTDYVLSVTGPATVASNALAVPPIDAITDAQAPRVDGSEVIEAPPIDTQTVLPLSHMDLVLALPPIEASASVRAGTFLRVRRMLLDPADAAVVPVLRPVFLLAINVIEGDLAHAWVEIQYDTDPDFGDPTVVGQEVELMLGANIVAIGSETDLSTTDVYYWQARLTIADLVMDWTLPWSFTVDPTSGDGEVPVTWTVTDDPTYPSIWSIDPESGVPGTEVTILGAGLLSGGSVTLAGTTMPIWSWEFISATEDASTGDREIGSTFADPEHDRIVVLVPDIPAPGGALRVVEP